MKVCCPGSFDPITYGHLDIIARSAKLFSEVIVAVGQNSTKNYIFSPEERLELVQLATRGLKNVSVEPLTGLLVDFCAQRRVSAIVKGLRFASDFDYELQISHLNSAISNVETILLPAGREYGTVSSTIVREIALNGGDISSFVPAEVLQAMKKKFS